MIDEVIREALDVDPSPEFLARVRTRIATDPAPPLRRWSWTFAAAGAMAVALVVAVIVSRPAQPIERRAGPVGPGTTAATGPAEPSVWTGPTGPALQKTPAPAARSARAVALQIPAPTIVRRPTTTDAEILLDPAETRALLALIAGVRHGRVDLAAVHRSLPLASTEPAPVVDIDIAPIAIEPIAPPSGAEGARQ